MKLSQEIIKGILNDIGSDCEFKFLSSLKPLPTNDTILNIGESSLLGTPVERQTLKEEIENCYLESKRKDAQKKAGKDEKKEPDKKEKQNAEAIRRARQERVLPEPSILEESYNSR